MRRIQDSRFWSNFFVEFQDKRCLFNFLSKILILLDELDNNNIDKSGFWAQNPLLNFQQL